MGIQLIGLFCLLVCSELSPVFAHTRLFRFGKKSPTHSYNNALTSSTESTLLSLLTNRKVFNGVGQADLQWDDLALNVSRMFGGNARVDVTGVRADINSGTLAYTDKTPDKLSSLADTSLPWIDTLKKKHLKNPDVYQRPRRAAKTNKSEPGSIVEKLESLPKASAQKQLTEPPGSYPTHHPAFPEEDYEDSTPLGPINTRPRAPGLPNPFYPVRKESYAAYALMVVSVIMFTAGIIGNIAIMCTVCHNYYMRSVSNSLLANLALWDFLLIFFCLPLVIFHQLTEDWLLGEFSCRIIPYFEVKINKMKSTKKSLCYMCG